MDAGAQKPRVAIAGATGYAGQELLRILARHSGVTLTTAMSSGTTSKPRSMPALNHIWDNPIVPLDLDRLTSEADFVFLALPEAIAAKIVPSLLTKECRVIDLSGAFRIRNNEQRRRWYPETVDFPEGVVYALPERHRDHMRLARVLACPGCYPTAALLALEPLEAAGLIEEPIIIDAKSGLSGAGKTPSDRTHFSENHGSVAAYGVFSHRHGPEIIQELQKSVIFVPHLVPLNRGILETIYVKLRPATSAKQIEETLKTAYADAPFVRLTGEVLPEIKNVAYTNFCDLGWVVDEATQSAVLVSCLDNLIKGAAGQAVQNLNIVAGFDERTGLL